MRELKIASDLKTWTLHCCSAFEGDFNIRDHAIATCIVYHVSSPMSLGDHSCHTDSGGQMQPGACRTGRESNLRPLASNAIPGEVGRSLKTDKEDGTLGDHIRAQWTCCELQIDTKGRFCDTLQTSRVLVQPRNSAMSEWNALWIPWISQIVACLRTIPIKGMSASFKRQLGGSVSLSRMSIFQTGRLGQAETGHWRASLSIYLHGAGQSTQKG